MGGQGWMVDGYARNKSKNFAAVLQFLGVIRSVKIAEIELLDLCVSQHLSIVRVEQRNVFFTGNLTKKVCLVINMVGSYYIRRRHKDGHLRPSHAR